MADLSNLVNARLVIALDWIGSVLMLGTIWGWVYDKVEPKINKRLKKSENRYIASVRLLRIKFGGDFEKQPTIRRFFKHAKDIGIDPSTSYISRVSLRINETVNHHLRRFIGTVTTQEDEAYLRNQEDVREVIGLLWRHLISENKYRFQSRFFKIIHTVTISLLSGRVGLALFLLGFILWNLSKALSIYLL